MDYRMELIAAVDAARTAGELLLKEFHRPVNKWVSYLD